MKAGKITAKLRDAVPVCFIADGKEVRRYKNIELPDELKELEVRDFHFDIPLDGKIAFHLIFDSDVLPAIFPAERPKVTREQKRAAKAAAQANGVNAQEPPSVPAKRCKEDKVVKEDAGNDAPPAKSLVESITAASDKKTAAPAKGRTKK